MAALKYRAKILLGSLALMSILSFILTTSNLRTSSSWKVIISVRRDAVSVEQAAEEAPYALPTPPTSTIALVWNATRRLEDIALRHGRYFESHLQLLPSALVPLSNASRVRFIHDYFERKRRFYLPATPRKSPPRFFSFPRHIPTLSEPGFSLFSSLFDAKNDTLLCFTAGSDVPASRLQRGCVCAVGWRGRHCSLPSVVMDSVVADRLRPRPRRVVYAFGLNHEVEHTLTTLATLWDVVDLFVVGEMNMTQYGDARPRFILELLRAGVFRAYERKMLYIPCSYAEPDRCLEYDSYLCDDIKYTCLEESGIRSLADLRDDDLIMYTDADEFIPAELVHTLRYHETSYQHFAVDMSWFVYGCAWRHEQGAHVIKFAATSEFVQRHSLLGLRGRRGGPAPVLVMNDRPAGFHCSWCFDVAGIQLKLISAVNSDYPRWGDYAAMLDGQLIEFLISRGTFFNLEDMMVPVDWSSLEHEPFRSAAYCKRYVFDEIGTST